MPSPDVCIRGSGIVGRSLALALSRRGYSVVMQGSDERPKASEDVRAYALNSASVALLTELKVWGALPADAATPVYEMRVEGDAPGAALEFSSWQQRAEALAWIVDAAALEDALAVALRFAPHVESVSPDRAVAARLTALCEGRDSAGRAARGVQWRAEGYGQRGIAARLVASQPHNGVARQWFRSPDVLALLPFDRPGAGQSYGLVWSVPDARADELLALDDATFESALNEATHGAAGTLRLASPRAAWPLAIAQADPVCGPGWVLLGDAAHLVHPLAGQGLNLGLGDVGALVRVLDQRESWRDLGDEKLLRRYARERALPVWAMGQVTDGLLRLFAHSAEPVRELRNRGLSLVNGLQPLKRWLAGRALGT
jgi:2-polyprenyl-6-methoxyphenol hydroxylase-like FAD-dependent oxidoreductase